ncbi:hypothetical protein ASC97_28800 [Rhizobium sp. Root1203]|jgi:hypothetical protein|uniref:hypothetical protein n=1 Tax=Rhizobium sp. Root1203 TaxID=1736427 RepID=UPI00070DD885|nr:hypothetical protein [Rhizobium sp. Root1203]KQV19958.1 hypothetical protein ASC97_28800 [Rhizobium sp. Root1203]
MARYKDKRRFRCEGEAGRSYVIVEQIKVARGLGLPRTDYMTEDGEIANRLDDDHFLILLNKEIVSVLKRPGKGH